MPTIEIPVERARIVINAVVSVPGTPGERHVEALLDTGADTTCVSRHLIEQLGAPQVGLRPMSGAGLNEELTPTFNLVVRVPAPPMSTTPLPSHFTKRVLVARLDERPKGRLPGKPCDLLIGMDFIDVWLLPAPRRSSCSTGTGPFSTTWNGPAWQAA